MTGATPNAEANVTRKSPELQRPDNPGIPGEQKRALIFRNQDAPETIVMTAILGISAYYHDSAQHF